MASPDQQESTEADDEHTRADLDLALPGEQDREHGERHHHHEHRQNVPSREIQKRGEQGTCSSLHQPARNGERPSHRRVDPVIDAARHDRQPKAGLRPAASDQAPTEG